MPFAAAASAAGAAVTLLSVAKPSGTVAGDVLIAAYATDFPGAGTSALPAGFTPIGSGVTTTVDGQYLLAGWREVLGSEPASFDFTNANGALPDNIAAIVLRYTGIDIFAAVNAFLYSSTNAFAASPAAIDASAITTTTDCDVLMIGAADNSGQGTVTYAPPSGMPEVADVSDDEFASIAAANVRQSVAGGTGAKSMIATGGTQSARLALLVALARRPVAPIAALSATGAQDITATSARPKTTLTY